MLKQSYVYKTKPMLEEDWNPGEHDPTLHSTVIRLAFDFPEAIPYIIPVRKTARFLLQGIGIKNDDAAELELIIGKLAWNAMEHARGGSYRLEIELYPDQAVVTVDKKVESTPKTFSAADLWRLKPLTKLMLWTVPVK